MATVKLFDINWSSHTAGPSPVTNEFGPNARAELFLMGCKKAAAGNPCKGCFNQNLWKDIPGARELDPVEMAAHIEKFAPQKYVTVVGGEPFDQPEGLTLLCEELKKRNFHIIVFTHYTLKETFKDWVVLGEMSRFIKKTSLVPKEIVGWTEDLFVRFLKAVDILVDGEYDYTKRIYDESLRDGFHDAIGSSNQIVWDLKTWREAGYSVPIYGQRCDNIVQLAIREQDNSLVFVTNCNSHMIFFYFLKQSRKYKKEKHTRWYTNSYDIKTQQNEDDFYCYYYDYRYDRRREEKVVKADIKNDVLHYCKQYGVTKEIIEALCEEIDDKNFFLYNVPWLNAIARWSDQGSYESYLKSVTEAW